MFRTLVIDDEFSAREVLKGLIERFCPSLAVCGEADSADAAIVAIRQLQPDLVFLDIDLGQGNAFEVLDAFQNPDFKVIITTAHDDFAIKAFRYRVYHYLLKPIDAQELTMVANELNDAASSVFPEQELDKVDASQQKILKLPTTHGIVILQLDEICYIQAEDRYAYVFINSGEKIFISQSLKAIASELPDDTFLKPHQSYIVRLDFIRKLQKTPEGLSLLLKDKTVVPVSRRNKEVVLQMLGMKD